MHVFYLYNICTTHAFLVLGAHEVRIGLELWMVVSHRVDDGIQFRSPEEQPVLF